MNSTVYTTLLHECLCCRAVFLYVKLVISPWFVSQKLSMDQGIYHGGKQLSSRILLFGGSSFELKICVWIHPEYFEERKTRKKMRFMVTFNL